MISRVSAAGRANDGRVCHHGRVTETFYERIGGQEAFRVLVERFYAGVAEDPPLRQLYTDAARAENRVRSGSPGGEEGVDERSEEHPEEDLGPAAERLQLFLEQYWGGPHTYSETRGHPRLRIRHAPYAVTPTQRDRWLRHMLAAVDSLALAEADDAELREYLIRAAQFMVNTLDDPEA